jgi:hypothetical protein
MHFTTSEERIAMQRITRWATVACLVGLAHTLVGCADESNVPGEDEPSGRDQAGSDGTSQLPAASDKTDAPPPAAPNASAPPAASNASAPPAGSRPGAPGGAGGGKTTCTNTLTFANVDGKCALGYFGAIHTSIGQVGTVTITYPCAGGAVVANVGSETFTGTISGTRIQLTNSGQFQTQEARGRGVYAACTVDSQEVISGDIASGTLSYVYSEHLASGACYFAGTCKASGTVIVAP